MQKSSHLYHLAVVRISAKGGGHYAPSGCFCVAFCLVGPVAIAIPGELLALKDRSVLYRFLPGKHLASL
jgi:hypothetical protein